MAWTAPRTWVTSELVTSSLLNTHLRDNLLALGGVVIDDHTVSGAVLASYDTNARLGGSITSLFKHLRLVCSLRGDTAAFAVGIKANFNNDTGANYDSIKSLMALTYSGAVTTAGTFADVGFTLGASARASRFQPFILDIPDYNGANLKGWAGRGSFHDDGNAGHFVSSGSQRASTAALTRVALSLAAGSFAVGCRFTLIGI